MNPTHTVRTAVLIAAATLVACSDSPTESRNPPPDAAVAALMSFGALAGPNGRVDCPAGGSITREASVTSVRQDDVVTVTWDVTMVHEACAVRLDDITLVSDGNAHVTGLDRRRFVEGGVGQVLESTSHQTGRMRIRGDGYDRTCDMDLTTTFDVATGRRTIRGTVCEAQVNFTI
jgi:hypothetical protein